MNGVLPFNLKPDMKNFYRKDFPIKGKRYVNAGNCNIKRCINLPVSFCGGPIDFFLFLFFKFLRRKTVVHLIYLTIFIYFNLLYASTKYRYSF